MSVRPLHGALVFLASLLALLAVAPPVHAQLLSPGPLHQTHAGIDNDDHCNDCHTSGRQLDASKCLKCHTALGQRIRDNAGLHGRAYFGRECASCHVEHIGRNSRLIRWPGGDERNLDHAQTGWALEGKHRAVGCNDCHKKRTKSGTRTFLGLSTTCTSCHEDPHKGKFGKTCQDCHSVQGWKPARVESFDHSRTDFALEGKHRNVECKGCHGEPPKYELEHDTCDDCHRDPHQGRFRQPCTQCHVTSGWKDVDALRRRHPGVELINGHRRVGCAKCHDRGNDREPSKGRECAKCHEPVHRAKFGRDCKECHASIEWLGLPERVGRQNHDKTRYPLRGRHVQAECAGCHPEKKPPAERYRSVAFERCDACHEDQHRGAFKQRDGGECATCHRVSGFRPTTFGIDLHATTKFALDGRHVAVPCVACHEGKRPRVDFRVPKQACADCHENPHGQQFQAEMRASGCAHCHSTAGWQSPKVEHDIWPLTGVHAQTECAACHPVSEADRQAGRGATYRGTPRVCDGCHFDVHAGQFRTSEPARACEACHDTRAFKITEFPHERIAGYALTGAHERVECAKCHPREPLRTGDTAVRYRLGYRTCKACHANPH